MLVYVTANSGSYRFGFKDVTIDGNDFCIHVEQTNHPQDGTEDMAGWFITVAVPDSMVANITEFNADMVSNMNRLVAICSNHKIIKENSLGTINPEVLDLWSDKNDKTPYEYAPVSGEVVWWKCNNGIHEDYQRKISNSQSRDFICPECGKLQGWFNRKEDIAGQQFGELTALYLDKSKLNNKRRTYWICKCSCGNLHSVDVTNLKTGNTTTCGDRMAHYSGENNGHWKGGITPKLVAERESTRYHDWRKLVYSKDYYTCQCCGNIHNGLNAHHIKNFSSNEELRYDLNNGITLCSECHPTASPVGFHNIYGTRNNTPEQLEEYINNRRKELNIDKPFKIIDYLNGDILKPNTV